MAEGENWNEVIQDYFATDLEARYMLGRLTDGAQRDCGRLNHALPKGSWKALCGAKPGKRSVGWSEYIEDKVTCPRCIKKQAASIKQKVG